MALTGLRVVIAEDDALVRMTMAGLIEDLGHVVIEAATAQEAMAALAGADILVTDMRLPDMKGDALAAAARLVNPNLAVVIATGENEDPASPFLWLQKPFTSVRLRTALEAAIASI